MGALELKAPPVALAAALGVAHVARGRVHPGPGVSVSRTAGRGASACPLRARSSASPASPRSGAHGPPSTPPKPGKASVLVASGIYRASREEHLCRPAPGAGRMGGAPVQPAGARRAAGFRLVHESLPDRPRGARAARAIRQRVHRVTSGPCAAGFEAPSVQATSVRGHGGAREASRVNCAPDPIGDSHGHAPVSNLCRELSLRRGALRDRDGLPRAHHVRLLDLPAQERAHGQGAREPFRLLRRRRSRSPSTSSTPKTARHYFCKVCGIYPFHRKRVTPDHLGINVHCLHDWSHYAGAGPLVRFVRVGTLDEPDRLPPDIHIFTASKQPWVVLPPGVPAVPEYYDREAVLAGREPRAARGAACRRSRANAIARRRPDLALGAHSGGRAVGDRRGQCRRWRDLRGGVGERAAAGAGAARRPCAAPVLPEAIDQHRRDRRAPRPGSRAFPRRRSTRRTRGRWSPNASASIGKIQSRASSASYSGCQASSRSLTPAM